MKGYLAPFSVMKEWLNRQSTVDSERLNLSYDDFIDVVRRLVTPTPVDEAWYCAAYPGVAAAVERGVFASATDHFIQHGYFDGKLPYESAAVGRRDLPHYSGIKASIAISPARGGFRVHISYDELLRIVRKLLVAVPLDEAWYEALYPGVAQAVASGDFASAFSHFIEHGYFENRMPFRIQVDEEWYRQKYPHVRTLIEVGTVESAADHFLKFGYGQGCLPHRL
jgi:hypothetical protein